MPTTQDEASRIVSITQEYMPLEDMVELYTRLNSEIGKRTDNDSLKQSLDMMERLVVYANNHNQPAKQSFWLWTVLQILIGVHAFLVMGMVFSFFALPFMAPYYIAIPLCTFIWFFSTSKLECKLTNAENYLRSKLGQKRIGGFVGHYFVKPVKQLYGVWRAA